MTNRVVARAELNAVRHDPSKDITVYIRTMAAAVSRLTAMGVVVDATTHKDLLLINLDSSFSAVRTVLLARATEPALEEITSLLSASAADPGIKQEDDGISSIALVARGSAPHRVTAATSSSPLTGTISDGFPLDSQGHRWVSAGLARNIYIYINAALEEYSLEDAKQRGAEMSPTVQETVRTECKQMSVAEFITPLWVAMATSILAVLHSRHNLSTKTWCQPGQMYQIWKAAGNRHRYEPSHPLTILERVLWKLVFRCALWELSPAGVVNTLYSDPEVVKVREMLGDDMSLHRNTLVWADSYQASRTITGSVEDALASGALYAIEEDNEWFLWNLRSGGGARGGDLLHATAEVAASEPATAPIAGPSTTDGAVTGAAPMAPSASTPGASTSVTTSAGTTPNPATAVEESGASKKSKTAEPADSGAAPVPDTATEASKKPPQLQKNSAAALAPDTETEPTKSGWRREARKKAEPIPLTITTRSRDPELVNAPKTKPPVVVEAGSVAKRQSPSKRKAVAKVAEVEEDDAGSNGFVSLFDAMLPLAWVGSDAERIEALLKSGEQKKTSKGEQPPNKWELRLDEERPVMEECVEFEVFCPTPNPNDPPVSHTHQWPVFENTPNDRLVLQRMIDSQLKRDGQLLHLHISVRNLDPDIRPSPTQSIVAVATKAAYEGLGTAQRHKLFRHRCVLVLDIGAEQPPAPFTPETLERHKNLDEDTDIQDCGLRTEC
ncbi:hypothetical protein B0H10DRAFT_2213438 [Mycena sp. CBHHK59/15]|nr:hypothetical protein B0H10DRAFT_2213438 [Mycena sp. CBHHK59/15]